MFITAKEVVRVMGFKLLPRVNTAFTAILFACLCFFLTTGDLAEAKIYKWVDDNGTVHYSNNPGDIPPDKLDPTYGQGVEDEGATSKPPEESQEEPDQTYEQEQDEGASVGGESLSSGSLSDASSHDEYDTRSVGKIGEKDADLKAFEVGIVGDTLYGSWNVYFGSELFEGISTTADDDPYAFPTFARYRITVSGGTLETPKINTFDAEPGDNVTEREELVTSLGQGTYNVSMFLHVQYKDTDDDSNQIINLTIPDLTVKKFASGAVVSRDSLTLELNPERLRKDPFHKDPRYNQDIDGDGKADYKLSPSDFFGQIVVGINVLNNAKGYWTKSSEDDCTDKMSEMIWISNRSYLLPGEGICIRTAGNTLARVILEEITETQMTIDVALLK